MVMLMMMLVYAQLSLALFASPLIQRFSSPVPFFWPPGHFETLLNER